MKITVTPMGDVVIDTDDVEAAISFVNTLRGGAPDPLFDPVVAELPEEFQARKAEWEAVQPKPEVLPEQPKRKYTRKPKRRSKQATSWQLGDTIDWMTANYDPDGSTPAQVAAAFGITNALASYRLRRLVTQGMVERVGRGRYLVTA